MNPIKSLSTWIASSREKRALPRKRVLILEGGGMRGVFLAGVLQAFTDHNYFPWKVVIGSSAGALTGTAYVTRQINIARDAFFTKLLTRKFIHPLHVFSNDKHVLDIDWMIDSIARGPIPLDLKMLQRVSPVLITATHYSDDSSPITLYLNSHSDNIFTALKATAAIPFLYKGFVEYKDYRLLDGGLLDPIPYKKALEMGYPEEDILIVVTRPMGYRKKIESFWISSIYESFFKDKKYRYLMESMENRFQMYNRILDELEENHSTIKVIYPPGDFEVERLTQDSKKILEGFEQGVYMANEFLFPERFKTSE